VVIYKYNTNNNDLWRNFMDAYNRGYSTSTSTSLAAHVTKTYAWMFLGLIITAITSFITVTTPLITFVTYNNFTFYGLIIFEFIFVFVISSRILKMSYATAALMFIVYSILNGMTISTIFYYYSPSSIAFVFVMAAAFFGAMALYGLITKQDLTSIGKLLTVGLIILIIVMVINLFLNSNSLMIFLSFVGIAIFLGLTAYDNQKIKKMYNSLQGTDNLNNIAI